MSSSPPEASPQKLRLKVVGGNAAGMVIEVQEELVIGRQAGGDGSLGSDIEISRQHARVYSDSDGRFGIEDLGSTNGTFINGRLLEGRATLEAGDRIEVGASALVVQVGSLQPTPTTSDTIAPPPGAGQSPTEEHALPTAAPADEPEPAPPVTASFALRIEVDLGAGVATVSLDDTADEVRLVHEDGRWRID